MSLAEREAIQLYHLPERFAHWGRDEAVQIRSLTQQAMYFGRRENN